VFGAKQMPLAVWDCESLEAFINIAKCWSALKQSQHIAVEVAIAFTADEW
jgi:hypothetical protein